MSGVPPTVTAAVRRLLVENGNMPLRLGEIFSTLQQRKLVNGVSKTHFKQDIVHEMFKRGEVRR
jgi:hypothetical protein